MSKIYADHDDFHVKATVLYMDSSANLFEDAECTKRASKEDVIDAFKKGTLLLEEPNGDEIVRPTSINVNDATVGTGGSGGAKQYRHDIELYNDDFSYSVYFTIFNTDSTNYTSEIEWNFDEAHYIGEHPEGAYNFVPTHSIPATGRIEAMEGYGSMVAYSVIRYGDRVEVSGARFEDDGAMQCHHAEFSRTWGQIYDTVTEIG